MSPQVFAVVLLITRVIPEREKRPFDISLKVLQLTESSNLSYLSDDLTISKIARTWEDVSKISVYFALFLRAILLPKAC